MDTAAGPASRHGAAQDPFAGGGAMGAAMAAFDWAATPLGPVADWTQSLRTTVNLCLTSRAPMMVVWGPQHVQLYNDALAPLMGPKHPSALGRPYGETFAEIFDEVMRPLLDRAYDRGEASYLENVPVSFHRHVPNEEMFWTFSWSPLRDETGRVAGALHPAIETTRQVVAERRLELLRDVATTVAQAVDVQEACDRTVDALSRHAADVPFSAVYLLDEVPGLGVPVVARRTAVGGVDDVDAMYPDEVDLTAATYTDWPLSAAAAAGCATTTELHLDPAWLNAWPWPDRVTTGVVLPLSRPGRAHPVALLALGLSPRRPYDEAQQTFLELLAGQLSTALATTALHEQQYRVTVALQRSLLPDTSRGSSALDIAARYLPGATEAEIGGDWYDVVPLGAGRTALVIGDVMGRGVHAAAVMGQLRAAVRAYAHLDLAPERVLELLDQLVEHISEAREIGQIVTCTYAVHDSADATLTLSNAGHPPAVVLDGGRPELWDGAVGPPLGTGLGPYAAWSRPFPPGAGVLLYTDGLVEQRVRDLDRGIGELIAAVTEAGSDDLERLADSALSIRSDDQHDDVAVLAVRVRHVQLPQPVVVDLRRDSRAARTGRHATREALLGWDVPASVTDDATFVVAELVNNAITHTGRPRQLRLRRLADRVVIEVSDADARSPRRLPVDGGSEGGRGLAVLAALASSWGVRFTGSGKVVWCEIEIPERTQADART